VSQVDNHAHSVLILSSRNDSRFSENMSLDGSPLVTQARHRDYLESAVRHLEEFKSFRMSSTVCRTSAALTFHSTVTD
jgi:hypothetical protein